MIEFLLGGSPFGPSGSLLGVPLSTVVVGVPFALLVGGIVWVCRISRVDPEPRSFRATTHPDPIDRVVRGAILAGLAFAVVLALGLAAR